MNVRMKIPCLLAAVVIPTMASLSAEPSVDPLWQKALSVARTNAEWVAGLVVLRSEVQHKGEVAGVHEVWTRSKLGDNNEIVKSTVKVLEDGEDVTKQELKKEAKKNKETKKAGRESGGVNPFDSELQDRVTTRRGEQVRQIAGRDVVSYAFEVRNTNGPTARGVAWLDKETGIPGEIEGMTLDPLPDKRLKAVTTNTRYETTEKGEWRVKEMRIVAKASAFFMTVDVVSIMTFSEYWRKPNER